MNSYVAIIKKIKIHPLFWAVAGIAVLTGYFWELLALFLIVFTHELGHALAAQFFNWRIKKILILPFGGLCEVDEFGNRPIKEELIIILAGPFQHILIGIFVLLLKMTSIISAEYASLLFFYNMMIFTFNLLPIWPLDGGKLVHLWLSSNRPFLHAYRQSLKLSFISIGIICVLILLLSPLYLHMWIVVSYLIFCLWGEWKQYRFRFMRFLLERYYGKQQSFSRLVNIHVDDHDFIHDAMEKFIRGSKHLIHIGGKTNVKLDENELLYAYFTEKLIHARLKDIVYIE